MREINIAKVIASKRKEKGITQDQLAEYIGVTKASVSKWETAQSFPDITLLPQLATYYDFEEVRRKDSQGKHLSKCCGKSLFFFIAR